MADDKTWPINGPGVAPCSHHEGLPFTENWQTFVNCPDCSTWGDPA